MKRLKTIGIIGGQGPASTVDFYDRIIKYYQDYYGVRYLSEYPPIIMISVPTPTLVKRVENDRKTFSLIADAVKRLEQAGADFIILTCVSLQGYVSRLQKLVKVPILKMTPILADYIKNKGYKSVGLLATYATIQKKTCDKDLNEKGIRFVVPNKIDQKNVGQVILNIIAGRTTKNDIIKLKRVAKHLKSSGVRAIMTACTELPLILKQSDIDIPLVNCNELYSQKIAQYSYDKN